MRIPDARKRKRRMPDDTRSILNRLDHLRLRFDRPAGSEKLKLLARFRHAELRSPALLQTYHEILCFLRAYPDNRRLKNVADRELRSFGRRVRFLLRENEPAVVAALADSGIVNTAVEHPFSLDLVRLLLKQYPKALEIDWANSDEEETGSLMEVLPLLVTWQENDIIDNDDDLTARAFLRRARPKTAHSDLETLVAMLTNSNLPPEIQRHLFEEAEIQARWDLRDSHASRTLARLPGGRLFFQTEPLKPRSRDLRAEILSKLARWRHLSIRDGETVVRLVNEVLAVRSRELFCITFAHPTEVYLAEPGRGVRIYLFGSRPEVRLPLEANFGALLVRNGIPIGYGVAACLFDRVEIAINVFPTFRAGESPFIIEQFFKTFYHHFGSRVFVVRSRQMGDGDDEPIQAGSFWFYYKLGFRAARLEIRALAEREYRRIVRNPNHRSTVAMLRRLSKSDVFFHIDPQQMKKLNELSVAKLGYVVTDAIANRFAGDRVAATRQSVKSLVDTLKLTNCHLWSENEQAAFLRLGPLLAAIPEIRNWNRSEKEALGRLIRAKGKPLERQFVLLCNRHPKFKQALERLAAKQRK